MWFSYCDLCCSGPTIRRVFQMGPLLKYKGRSYISGVQNVSLGPTDPPMLVRFMMSSTAVCITTYSSQGLQGDSVNRIKNRSKKNYLVIM
jgi:hypothetical protein